MLTDDEIINYTTEYSIGGTIPATMRGVFTPGMPASGFVSTHGFDAADLMKNILNIEGVISVEITADSVKPTYASSCPEEDLDRLLRLMSSLTETLSS